MPKGWGQRTNKLWLRTNETAQFYFLVEYDQLTNLFLHVIEKPRGGGKNPIKLDVLCTRRDYDDDSSTCPICVEQERGPMLRIVTPVWVKQIIHPNNVPGSKWRQINTRDGATGEQKAMFAESIEDVMLWNIRPKVADQLISYLSTGGDDVNPTPVDTILDRGFRVRILGEGQQRNDVFSHEHVPGVPDAVLDARKNARDIDEWMAAEFTDEMPKATAAGGAKKAAASAGQTVSYATGPDTDADADEAASDDEEFNFD